ncbi:hypothetical protein WN944_017998 [Citrus x changshan-huyou]|uniref:Uncharacterized protein n=1 Tax=Citrus x changshan-huyou TaxID=2935761 RepID=A0AAP0LVZ9_9ROSI
MHKFSSCMFPCRLIFIALTQFLIFFLTIMDHMNFMVCLLIGFGNGNETYVYLA